MNSALKFIFKDVQKCNMCGSPVGEHKFLGKRLNMSQGKKPHKKMV